MTCLVTVGSTLFNDLINEVVSERVVKSLSAMGISSLNIQIGKGSFNSEVIGRVFDGHGTSESGSGESFGLRVDYYRYKKSLLDDMKAAKLVIGHAGAGTCLEVLQIGKPLVVVINSKLMDNHQAELAEALSERNNLLFCSPETLSTTLNEERLDKLAPYKAISQKGFAEWLSDRLNVV